MKPSASAPVLVVSPSRFTSPWYVLAIHARENGVGTLFPPEPGYDLWLEQAEAPVEPEPEPPRPSGRPTLKVIIKNAANWLRFYAERR